MVLPAACHLQRLRIADHPAVHADPEFGPLGRQQLSHFRHVPPAHQVQVEGQRIPPHVAHAIAIGIQPSRIIQQRFCPSGIVPVGSLYRRLVSKGDRRQRPVGHRRSTAEDSGDNGLPVSSIEKCLPHPNVVQRPPIGVHEHHQ